MNRNARYFILILFGVVVIMMLMGGPSRLLQPLEKPETLTFSQFKQMLTADGRAQIGSIFSRAADREEDSVVLRITPRKISGRYVKPNVLIERTDSIEKIRSKTIPFEVEIAQGAVTEKIQQSLDESQVLYKFENPEESSLFSSILQILPFVLLIGFLWMFMMRQIQATGNRAMSFGKSKARLMPEGKKKLNFTDVAGCDEAKTELVEVVEFLKDPKKFQAIGAKIPKGVLLVGPPGTGKTLLARAVAGEAGVPFFSISGSDFVEMFVGVGASRVRDLFEQAKRQAPCIVFIDEIDAVGRLRGAGLGGGHDEREQTLNQMLVEMDGFEENEGIIVVAATNRPDVLDPALLRPGRFDRQVVVDIPDVKGREAILKIHAKKVPLTSDVVLSAIARGTPGFTGADLANLINEAALLAARRNKRRVTQEELEEAKDKVLMGPERRSFMITQKEKEVIAYHEGGHALLGTLLPYAEPVHKVTIIPRGRALGLTQQLPEDDKHIHPSRYWEDRICVLMGGLLAEEIVFGDRSTGASNDIQVATNIARRMVCEWGMSQKIGTINYSTHNDSVFLGREIQSPRNYSDETASTIDEEVNRIITEQREKGRSLLHKHREKLERIAKALLAHESISGNDLTEIMGDDASESQKRSFEGPAQGMGDPAPAPAT